MTKLALTHSTDLKYWEVPFLRRLKSELSQQSPEMLFQFVDEVEEADVVVYVDPSRSARDVVAYRQLLQWADKEGKRIFALSFADQPLGALPGIYTSLAVGNFDPTLHLSWPHLEAPNKYVESLPQTCPQQASQLFTFSGSCSALLRRKMFAMYESGQGDNWTVSEIKRWYNHTEDELKAYVTEILDSYFVLCPRGIAAYSHRIIEAMLLDRIPVIIADDWVPFSFPEKDYYIVIPEKKLGDIVSHLERELVNYDSYLSNLLAVKSKWLTEGTRYSKAIGHMLEFHRQYQNAHEPKALLERLDSYEFRRSNGLLSHQKMLTFTNAIARRGKKMLKDFTGSKSWLSRFEQAGSIEPE